MVKRSLIATIGVAMMVGASASGHELEDNRATLVLRDQRHLSLTVYLSYPEALHRALAPEREFAAFLLIYSAMKPEDFQKQLLRAQSRFQSGVHVYLPEDEAPLVNWSWPDAKTVQAMLQQRIMKAMVDPNIHAHEPPVEVHAEVNAAQGIAAARVRFPQEWRRVLLVWFRPSQQWLEGSATSPAMKF